MDDYEHDEYDAPPGEDEDFEPFIDPEIQEDPDTERFLQADEDRYERYILGEQRGC